MQSEHFVFLLTWILAEFIVFDRGNVDLPTYSIPHSPMNKTILITGANAGLGKEAARQLALMDHTEKIYLGCRNEQKAKAAQESLENATGKNIFEILIIDVSSPTSVRGAVGQLQDPIDALIMNAGGMGGKEPSKITDDGVTQIFAANVLGHVILLEELLKAEKLSKVALYSSSEAARGVKKMGMKQPELQSSSVDEFASIIDGSFFNGKFDNMYAYGLVKYIATLWMLSLARKHTNVRIVPMSPGGTSGTNVMDDLKGFQKIFFKYIGGPLLLPMMGMMHSLDKGAKRYVDGISDEQYKTGTFYASKESVLTGPMIDQSSIFPKVQEESVQDNAYAAIHRFIKVE